MLPSGSRTVQRMACGLAIAVLMLAGRAGLAESNSITYQQTRIYNVYVCLATIDLNDQSLLVTPAVSLGGEQARKSFCDYLESDHSLAQITGTFFDLRSGVPIGDVVIHGKPVYHTRQLGTALVVTPDNAASMMDGVANWHGYESVLQGGLRLVANGKYALDPLRQGFRDRYMQRDTSRIAVGILPGNRMVFVRTGHALLPKLACIMLQLGCTDAMALDGGGSTGFAYDGKALISTPRKLANVLMVVRRSPEEIAQRAEAVRQRAAQIAQANAATTAPGFTVLGIHFHWPDCRGMWRSIFG